MFLEEGRIVRSIDHPNVVKVYEVAEDRGILYMAMEWVEGDSLRAVIKESNGGAPFHRKWRCGYRRHRGRPARGARAPGQDGELRNLVHCDISPHNILVGLDSQAKLVDFGVANATVHSELGNNDTIKGRIHACRPSRHRRRRSITGRHLRARDRALRAHDGRRIQWRKRGPHAEARDLW